VIQKNPILDTMADRSWLAPAKFADKEKACDLTAKKLINPINTNRLITFIVGSIALYAALYLSAVRFGWEYESKKYTDHYYQVLYLIILSSFIFTFGNFNNTLSYWFLLGMVAGGFGIAYLGTLPGFNFSTGSITSLSGTPLYTVVGISAVLLYLAYQTYKYYKKCGMTKLFFILFLTPVAILAAGLLLARLDSSSVEVHLHHWQWALVFVFFARFPGVPWQSFLTGLFVGIVIDGIARYGPDPLFNPVP
jgi:hypothetical protein